MDQTLTQQALGNPQESEISTHLCVWSVHRGTPGANSDENS